MSGERSVGYGSNAQGNLTTTGNNNQNNVTQIFMPVQVVDARSASDRERSARLLPPTNLCFTARKEYLKRLRSELVSVGRVAIVGMPGVGKTTTAAEYVHLWQKSYTHILWIEAENETRLLTGLCSAASCFHPTVPQDEDLEKTARAVLDRLDKEIDWLLVLNNVDDLSLVCRYVKGSGQGHLLLTTRVRVTRPVASPLELEVMSDRDAAELFLKRGNQIGADGTLEDVEEEDRRSALTLASLLSGLPLGVELAGAYLDERQITPSAYLRRYQTRRAELHKWRSELANDPSPSLSTTFELALEQVELHSPIAAELIRHCACLAPTQIPDELLVAGALEWDGSLGSTLADEESRETILAAASRFSLIRRNQAQGTIIIHRLVQETLLGRMDDEERNYRKKEIIKALSRAVPSWEVSHWPLWDRIVMHALSINDLDTALLAEVRGSGKLLSRIGLFLHERARHSDAKLFLEKALLVDRITFGNDHPDVARDLNHLSQLLQDLDDSESAEPLIRTALSIDERYFGSEHHMVANDLITLAQILQNKNQISEAEKLMRRALEIDRKVLGDDHPEIAATCNNLALILIETNQLVEAEHLLVKALGINLRYLPQDHLDIAKSFSSLAHLLHITGRMREAELLMRSAIRIAEHHLGDRHPTVATLVNNLARLLQDTNQLPDAETLLLRALNIDIEALGSNHSNVAVRLNNLATLYLRTNRLPEAEQASERALRILTTSITPHHPQICSALANLASVFQRTDRKLEAEQLLYRAISTAETSFGLDHPTIAIYLANLASLMLEADRYTEALLHSKRSVEILVAFQHAHQHENPNFRTAVEVYAYALGCSGFDSQEIRDAFADLGIEVVDA